MKNLTEGDKVTYLDEFTGQDKLGIIKGILSIQVVLIDGKLIFNKNIKQVNKGKNYE